MQWDNSPNAGFTAPEATPWLPLADDYRQRNVAAQDADPASMLNFFRRLTALRRAEPALNRGEYEAVDLGAKDVLAYRRTAAGSDGFLVVLNFGNELVSLPWLDELLRTPVAIVLSTDVPHNRHIDAGSFVVNANEGVVIRLPA